MIIYFADRNLNIVGHASTSLPGGFRILSDQTVEEIGTGVNTFTCMISYNDSNRRELETSVTVGRFILKSSGRAFREKENSYDSLYQIIETEFDTLSQELTIVAEDAGLDLLNKTCPASTQTNKTISQMLSAFLPSGWTKKLIDTPTDTKTYSWDGESTATERINSVANLFGCEVFYSFTIERFEVTSRNVNVIRKRGNQTAVPQLRLNLDIDRIVTKSSIADLATAFVVTGGIPEKAKDPINLKGYSYSYTDSSTGDVYSVDTATGQMRNTSAMKKWSSVLDTDGLILRTFSFDTTSKATLAGQARAELQKQSRASVEYEVDFIRLPDDVKVGDRINIIDEDGELFLEARLLKIESSATSDTQSATIGDYVLKDSGISSAISALAQEFASKVKNGEDGESGITISVVSNGGNIFHNAKIQTTLTATLHCGQIVITNQTQLEEAFGSSAEVQWWNTNGQKLGTGFSYAVNSDESSIGIICRFEGE